MPLILKYCQAHGMGLFGPRIIWIFAQFIDLVNLGNFDDCSVQDRKEFSKGMLTMGMFVHDLENFQLSLGMTGGQYNEMIASRIANFAKDPRSRYTYLSFDTVSGGIFLVDAVEKRLQANGTTFRNEIANPIKRLTLQTVIAEAIYDLDINLYAGKLKYAGCKAIFRQWWLRADPNHWQTSSVPRQWQHS